MPRTQPSQTASTPAAATTKPRFTYDRAYQAKLLKVLFQDPHFTCTAGVHLSHEHFESRRHRWLAKTIIDYAKKYGHGISLDAITHQAERDVRSGRVQKKDYSSLIALAKRLKRKVQDRTYIKDDLFLFIKHQAVHEAIVNSLDPLERGDYDTIDKNFERAATVKAVTMGGGVGRFFTRDLESRMKRRRAYVKDGVPTGLTLDSHLKPGGLPPKQLGVVAAPPSGGKSNCLVHIGKSAILESDRPERVLHITLELADHVIEDKYDAAFSGVVLSALEDEANEVEEAAAALGKKYGDFLVVKEFPPGKLSVKDIRSYIRQLERFAFYPTILIVDYADLLKPSEAGYNKRTDQEIGDVYTELRALAWELEIPVWTASQANRAAVEKPVISIQDLAESFKKAMIADVIIALCQTSDEKKSKRARFFVAKNRNGAQDFQFGVKLDWARARIKNM